MRTSTYCAAIGFMMMGSLVGFVAQAKPVVYTLTTVTDGHLGNREFKQAVVILRMEANTDTVKTSLGAAGGPVYSNFMGRTTVQIIANGRTSVATFDPGEIYVRYDTGAGIAGFGSPINPTYPITLGCDNYAYPASSYIEDCVQGDWGPNPPYAGSGDGIANLLAATAAGYSDAASYSPQIFLLPISLSRSTLLTGRTHACATTYSVGVNNGGWGNLQTCSAAAPRGLHTDHGDFYVQDMAGGSEASGPYFWDGWFVANGGFLQVDVMEEDE
ncbi:MAG: hypothetical protein ACYDBZ_09755 [Steroidobacteraceae bacterium]